MSTPNGRETSSKAEPAPAGAADSGPMFDDRYERAWVPPSASLACRRPPLKSRSSTRGTFVNPRTHREVVYESTLERDLAYILLAHRDVETMQEQPREVEYVDRDGVVRTHIPDFRVELRDRTRISIDVKPAIKVGSSGIEDTLDLIRSQSKGGFADCFVLRTGEHITRDRAADARLIHKARRMRNEDHVREVLAVASALIGSIRIDALLAATRNGGYGLMAVVCLIGDGVLEHVGPGRISHDSFVRPAPTATRSH
ncbi:hypothetical protein [Microvirga sp. P5_D2]